MAANLNPGVLIAAATVSFDPNTFELTVHNEYGIDRVEWNGFTFEYRLSENIFDANKIPVLTLMSQTDDLRPLTMKTIWCRPDEYVQDRFYVGCGYAYWNTPEGPPVMSIGEPLDHTLKIYAALPATTGVNLAGGE